MSIASICWRAISSGVICKWSWYLHQNLDSDSCQFTNLAVRISRASDREDQTDARHRQRLRPSSSNPKPLFQIIQRNRLARPLVFRERFMRGSQIFRHFARLQLRQIVNERNHRAALSGDRLPIFSTASPTTFMEPRIPQARWRVNRRSSQKSPRAEAPASARAWERSWTSQGGGVCSPALQPPLFPSASSAGGNRCPLRPQPRPPREVQLRPQVRSQAGAWDRGDRHGRFPMSIWKPAGDAARSAPMFSALTRRMTVPRHAVTRSGWNRIGQATGSLEQ